MLINTEYLLRNKKKLTIGYFGGSITEGAGASKQEETSWRAITSKWFHDTYPNSEITQINAAIGGTGSMLGLFRCEYDMLKYNPDLIFVEFAVNDYKVNADAIIEAMEGILLKTRSKNSYAEIVLVYTITKNMYDDIQNGIAVESLELHKKIAKHYNVASIDVGEILMNKIDNGEGNWETYTTDLVHPSDFGHRIYADEVIGFLRDNLNCNGEKKPFALPKPYHEKIYVKAELLDSWDIDESTFKRCEESLANRYSHMICSNENGSELTLKFKGTTIGIYYMTSSDSGDFEWSVDDCEFKESSTWDEYALKFDRASYRILSDELDNKEHKLKIRAMGKGNAQSKGEWIRIGAFLVGEKNKLWKE